MDAAYTQDLVTATVMMNSHVVAQALLTAIHAETTHSVIEMENVNVTNTGKTTQKPLTD